MSWFTRCDLTSLVNRDIFTVAQLSDCHLFAEKSAQYFDAYVWQHLDDVLKEMRLRKPDVLLLTGDMTQDHTDESYRLLAAQIKLRIPHTAVFWLPGNHDDLPQLQQFLAGEPFRHEKVISIGNWAMILLNSKSDTPAGYFTEEHLATLNEVLLDVIAEKEHVALFCHHHLKPLDIYLDKHRCMNGEALLQQLNQHPQVRLISHGHTHIEHQETVGHVEVLATPATSIQFVNHPTEWRQENSGPAYRWFEFSARGWRSDVVRLPAATDVSAVLFVS